jgi:hypothetical protein
MSHKHLKVGGFVVDSVTWSSEIIDGEKILPFATEEDVVESIWTQLSRSTLPSCDDTSEQHWAYILTLSAGRIGNRPAENSLGELVLNYWAYRLKVMGKDGAAPKNQLEELQNLSQGGDATSFATTVGGICHFRRFFCTQEGYYGLEPAVLQNGDLCCVIFGSTVPFILRSGYKKPLCQVLGACYVQSIMRGEAVQRWRNGDLIQREFALY